MKTIRYNHLPNTKAASASSASIRPAPAGDCAADSRPAPVGGVRRQAWAAALASVLAAAACPRSTAPRSPPASRAVRARLVGDGSTRPAASGCRGR